MAVDRARRDAPWLVVSVASFLQGLADAEVIVLGIGLTGVHDGARSGRSFVSEGGGGACGGWGSLRTLATHASAARAGGSYGPPPRPHPARMVGATESSHAAPHTIGTCTFRLVRRRRNE
eukprot:2246333-Prymnesium_polylepis.1